MTSLAQRSWDAFSAEDREERRALGGLTLKMYDEAEVPLDHALRHWSYREFPRDLGHISKINNGEVIGSYLEAGGNPDATLYGGTYTMLGLYLEEHVHDGALRGPSRHARRSPRGRGDVREDYTGHSARVRG